MHDADIVETAIDQLLARHYAIVRLPAQARGPSDKILRESLAFFRQEEALKTSSASLELTEGYREFGAENDQRTGRPDLSEAFSVWFRNRGDPSVEAWSGRTPLHRAMVEGLESHAAFADDLLEALRRRVADTPGTKRIDVRHESYFKINFSRPSSTPRDTISDAHEDGYLLTILRAAPGLVVAPGRQVGPPSPRHPSGQWEIDGPLEPVDIGPGEVIILPSSPTFYLTGGKVLPLFHAVSNTGVAERQSLMMFVKSPRGGRVPPWTKAYNFDVGAMVDGVTTAHIDRHGWDSPYDEPVVAL